MARVIPLFKFDAGWPFVIAGLALLMSALLIPAQRELHELKGLVQYHRAREQQAFERLAAYDRFLQDLGASDERILRRLAASQLNLKPAGEDSLMLAPSMNDTVVEWIDASVPLAPQTAVPAPDTLLSRLATGPRRLWILGVGTFLMFIGLFVGPETEFSGRKRKVSAAAPSTLPVAVLAPSGCELKCSTSDRIPSLVEAVESAEPVEMQSTVLEGEQLTVQSHVSESAALETFGTSDGALSDPSLANESSIESDSFAECDIAPHAAWSNAAPTEREVRVAMENEQDPRSQA